MNDESSILQRDQMKKPSLQRYGNGNLSSPFPFMEFGMSTNSSLNNILSTFPRETELTKKTRLENQGQIDSITDPYLRPLNIERMKSSLPNSNSDNNGIPHFIRSSNNNLRNNDFSANIFLRHQSARTDSTTKDFKTLKGSQTNDANKVIPKLNGYIMPRPNTAAFPLKKLGLLSDDDNNIRPSSSKPQNRALNGSFMPVVGTQTGTKFYLKSFKTDALIYNNHEKLFPQESVKETFLEKPAENDDMKNGNSHSLYLQVKNEVAEYRKQRLKEANLDLDNIPQLKMMSVDEICPKRIEANGTGLSVGKIADNCAKNPCESVETKKVLGNVEQCFPEDEKNGDDNLCVTDIKTLRRSKSVTFNDRVETREISDDLSFDYEKSRTPDDSDESSTAEDESQESVISTDSESEDEDSKSSITNATNSQLSSSTKTPIKIPTEKSDSPQNDSTESSDEENNQHYKVDSPTPTNKYPLSSEALVNEIKSSVSSESRSRTASSISSSNSASTLSSQSRPSSASSISRINSAKSIKRPESKTKSNSSISQQDLLDMKVFKETELNMPLIFSKFPFVPPVINFVGEGEKVEQLPWQLRKLLRWRTSLLTPVIVKQIITRSGFRPSRLSTAADDLENVETNDWILYFGKHMKGPVFQTLKNYQKVNHFPGSFQLGRKDRLWRNICKMQQEIGKKEFDFIPQTFCLPTDLELFKQCWESGGNKFKWIIKPPASARGIGIKVVYKWNQIPKRRPVVIQRYISNPYLINESKFDLRLYVFLSSIDPLRIYLHENGLVRFASTKYTNSVKSLQNRFVHLTNYSVNKLNVEYLDNNDTGACKGHKWSLKSLWSYLRKKGVNTDIVWDRIKDLVVKTVISAEEMIGASVNTYCSSPYNVKELFGFDVLLDEDLKPWILEVNVSPSLYSDTQLDVAIKGGMIKDVLNLSGFMLPEVSDIDPPTNSLSKASNDTQSPSSDLHIDLRFWLYTPSSDEKAKSKYFVSLASNGSSNQRFDINDILPYQILDCLTPNDVRCLVDCYDEYERKGHFQRVYPVQSTVLSKKYLSCCERVRYSNLLVAAFITKYNRNGQDFRLLEKLCQKKLHLLSAASGDTIDPKHIWHSSTYSGDN